MSSHTQKPLRRAASIAMTAVAIGSASTACGWQGLNSLPLPGTQGRGEGAFVITAQLPDVDHIEPNSRVRIGDVDVGTVTKIERQDWHALVTMRLDADVDLPANATAKVGQTSLLGSLHVELAPPADAVPQGKLRNGSLIPLSSAAAYPTTEQTLTMVSLLLNGGGLGQVQDITKAFAVAFNGREKDLRSLVTQLDEFIAHVENQTDDIVAATESFNTLAGQFADQQPVVEEALRTLPDALTVLKDQRENLAETLDRLGKFSALANNAAGQTKDALAKELNDIGPVLESLANAGPALTRSLSFFGTFPWPKEGLAKWNRGDFANQTVVVDMTLSRLDATLLTGTRFEGDLTELELQWGRTIGQLPSPYTAGNPLVAPYHFNQGP